ncbi:MAG: hypothetical protein JSR84_01055 [Proteobacteria bacterium]|nr:hypothetical protein [Pseudomonadota bacterium]
MSPAPDRHDPAGVLATIALGLPTEDDWHSAADFMEHVAGVLEDAGWGHLRPDHYPEED